MVIFSRSRNRPAILAAVDVSLPLPVALARLIEDGGWPTRSSANRQNLSPLVAAEIVDVVAPDERSIYLEPPPFATLASEIEAYPQFWYVHGALHEIDPDLALVIGDFGPGSDAAIVLDYRGSHDEPSVRRLAWSERGNHWIEVAPTFEMFARALQLVY